MSVLDAQLENLRDRFPQLEARKLSSGTTLVVVPEVRVPDGWNKTRTTIQFLVPAGYPYGALDCFWADSDLRLADGRVPQNTGATPIPEVGPGGLWFSWHLAKPWNPNRDTLSSWMNTVLERLRQRQ